MWHKPPAQTSAFLMMITSQQSSHLSYCCFRTFQWSISLTPVAEGGPGNEQKALATKDATFHDHRQFASFLRRQAQDSFMKCLLSKWFPPNDPGFVILHSVWKYHRILGVGRVHKGHPYSPPCGASILLRAGPFPRSSSHLSLATHDDDNLVLVPWVAPDQMQPSDGI